MKGKPVSVKTLISLAKAVARAENDPDVISISTKGVQINNAAWILEHAEDAIETANRNFPGSPYPWNISTRIQGVLFYALLTQAEYDELVDEGVFE